MVLNIYGIDHNIWYLLKTRGFYQKGWQKSPGLWYRLSIFYILIIGLGIFYYL